MLILSGTSHPRLAADLAKSLSAPLARRSISYFTDQTFKIRLNSDVKGETVVLVQSLIHPVHDHLIELLLLADAAKSAGASKIIAVIPYLAYSKQDQIFLPGEPLSVRTVAQVLSSTSIDEIITLDLHHSHIANFFSIPIHNLSFLPSLLNHDSQLKTHNSQPDVVVAPDAGAAARTQLVADQLNLPLFIIDKSRNLFTGKVSISPKRSILADRQGYSLMNKDCLIIDDLIVTGATLVAAAKFLKSKGAKTVTVFATHGLFTDGFQKLSEAGINRITISDSIPNKNLPSWVKTISIVPTLKNAIENIIKG